MGVRRGEQQDLHPRSSAAMSSKFSVPGAPPANAELLLFKATTLVLQVLDSSKTRVELRFLKLRTPAFLSEIGPTAVDFIFPHNTMRTLLVIILQSHTTIE